MVIGIHKSIAEEYPMWVAIVMGGITGSFGGVLRDILINQEPLFFRKDIYATACLAGGIAYWGVESIGLFYFSAKTVFGVTIIFLRMCPWRWNWSLPVLSYENDAANEQAQQPGPWQSNMQAAPHKRRHKKRKK